MNKFFEYFVKYDRQDAVRIGVIIRIDGMPDSRSVITGSDADLTAAAIAEGNNTWDENTVCAVYGLERLPEPVVAEVEVTS